MPKRTKHSPDQQRLFERHADLIDREAQGFTDSLREAVSMARSEESIRIATERQLGILAAKLGVRLEGHHEFTLLRGRIDSVYGHAFIEYKNPNDKSACISPEPNHPGTRKAIAQVERRFADFQTKGGAPVGIFGVAFDGRHFVFARSFAGNIRTEDPVPLSRWTAKRFLWALFNLAQRGRALTPEALAEDFGSDSDRGVTGVQAFTETLLESSSLPRVEIFYKEWTILFGEVCGFDLSKPRRSDLKQLSSHYGMSSARAPQLLFGLHTYYAIFMKVLAAHVVNFFQHVGKSPLQEIVDAPTSVNLRKTILEIEEGGIFRHLGISNFLEGDIFSWYLDAWNEAIENSVRSIADRLLSYNPASLRDNPALARDLLKGLYHALFPRQVRHNLGEYYTPDWLAETTLDLSGFDGDPRQRLLDPACGSGTFLVLALVRVRRWLESHFEQAPEYDQVGRLILNNIIGFDLNPLAVLAARTNYLIHFLDLFTYRGAIEIPVYLCDSVLTPFEHGQRQRQLVNAPLSVPTSAGQFDIPAEVAEDRDALAKYCNILSRYGRALSGFTFDDFASQCQAEGISLSEEVRDQHERLFTQIRKLDEDGKNGVWAWFIKNSFAPVFLRSAPVDFVVGNPPWINWEELPGRVDTSHEHSYRKQIAHVYRNYGLFSLGGTAGRYGGGKKDLAMLFVYVSADHYLRPGGRLAFVITQTLFKSVGAGDGFRKLSFTGADDVTQFIEVDQVHDLSAFQSFEGATNRTAIMACTRGGDATRYPARYMRWSKSERIVPTMAQHEVLRRVTIREESAIPVDPKAISSPWLTADASVLSTLAQLRGPSDYTAIAGACTWLNAVYYVRVLERVPGGVLIENAPETGKNRSIPRVRHTIEPDLLYPLLRGRDCHEWSCRPELYLLLTNDPETRQGIPEDEMRQLWPRTYSYFKQFEGMLRARSGLRRYFNSSDPFYSIYNVDSPTTSSWKVLWREQSFQAAVSGPVDFQYGADSPRPTVPSNKLMLVSPAGGADEAHFLCGVLNSLPARLFINAYSLPTSTTTHVLRFLRIPRYTAGDPVHREIADISRDAHSTVYQGIGIRQDQVIRRRLLRLACVLWGLDSTDSQRLEEHLPEPGLFS